METDFRHGANEKPPRCGHIIRVAFESGADTELDYLLPDELWPVEVGRRIEAPFGRKNKLQTGFCVQITDRDPDEPPAGAASRHGASKRRFKLKTVAGIIDKEVLGGAELMSLARWISVYYVCPLGQVLAAMVPSAVKKGIGVTTEKLVCLAEYDAELVEQLRGKKQKQIATVLKQTGAVNSQNALNLQHLLAEVGCTMAPVKRLVQSGIVKITQRQVLKSLPVIPDEMTIKTDRVTLNADQCKAVDHIIAQIASGRFGVTLLHGVTDSGKTEVYIRAIEASVRQGRGAIVLLPEIALTAQTVQRFNDRFERIAVMHSGLTAAQRNVQWRKIEAASADVVIGARSAVFAPLPNLGLIIVDEEHEPSYKQDTQPRYNARDVAIKRAQSSNFHCVLGTATPSLETLLNCRTKDHFNLVSLPKRVMDLPMPEMRLIDMRDRFDDAPARRAPGLISGPLAEMLTDTMKKGEQAILLLNRRGYSNFVFCPSCKHTLHCQNCDVTLTFHRSKTTAADRIQTITGKHMEYGHAMCHYCGSQTLVPQKCPLCGKGMAMIGLGSQRLEEELTTKFPQVRVARVDSDSMRGKDYYRLLRDFSRGSIDVLAGTQMLAKGLHFPNVTLVGIISADTCLYLPDFRANERTFQLISQVAGRAGRSDKKGTVLVQTFLAEQPAIRFAMKGDFHGFVKEELKHRQACNLPPFWRLAAIVLRDEDFDRLQVACGAMRERIDFLIGRHSLDVTVRGPMPAVISRIQRFHRMQILLQAPTPELIQQLFATLRCQPPIRPAVKIAIDIDPVNLL